MNHPAAAREPSGGVAHHDAQIGAPAAAGYRLIANALGPALVNVVRDRAKLVHPRLTPT